MLRTRKDDTALLSHKHGATRGKGVRAAHAATPGAQTEMPVRPRGCGGGWGGGDRCELRPETLPTCKRLPEPSQGRLPGTANGRAPRWAAAGIAWWASPAREAERKWRPRLCTNHVRPAGECHSAPREGSEGVGRALASPPRRRHPRPGSPRGRRHPPPRACQRDAARSPEAPRPHLARSVAEAGQAERVRPARGARGDPEAPGARPRPGPLTPPGTLRPSPPPTPAPREDKCSDKAPGPGRTLAGGKEDAASLPGGGDSGPAPRKPGAPARPREQPRSEPARPAPDRWHPMPATLPRAPRVGEPRGPPPGAP
ncbi:unnamed protein product [Rangifer tarandus platyrhynchus]|uniref:Uncharacterized protein n=2 Tax=Rangifer tarandus platyrhynchus TaxID=3082113 RepID=A0ACB0F4A6_RANTA|nr:unnamed protein product [Rangifer tarandus platyrhynchus]CAI9707912.1 unnamed protein product [Rangifer tarandus platyrhynchus]